MVGHYSDDSIGCYANPVRYLRNCAIFALFIFTNPMVTMPSVRAMDENILAAASASDGPLSAYLREPIIYVPIGEPATFSNAVENLVYVTINDKPSVEGFFDNNGTPVKQTIESSDSEILEILTPETTEAQINKLKAMNPTGHAAMATQIELSLLDRELQVEKQIGGFTFKFTKAGIVSFRIAVGTRKVELPIRVVPVPIKPGDSSSRVVEAMGLPNHKVSMNVSWPNREQHDGIFYNPSADDEIISADHWRYDKFPGLVISIVNGSIYKINSNSTTEMLLDLEKQKLKRAAEFKVAERKAAALARREASFKKWSSKSGGFNIEAVLTSYANGVISLEKRDGTKIKVEVSKLSDADQTFVNKWRQQH